MKMRRTSFARAPTQRSMPISRVRSITLMVIALTSPTRLMATISSPRTVTDVVSPALPAMASRFWTWRSMVVDWLPPAASASSTRAVIRSIVAWSWVVVLIQ